MSRATTETAHVLFTDRVGYSLVSIEEKAILDRELLDAVRSCPAIAKQSADDCIKLDSGDGVALVFFGEPTDAIEAAIYLQEHVADGAKIKLRIGLHSGLVTRREDANNKINVSGPGIEKAQRAMSCADGSQPLMTEFFAENLRAFEGWQSRLADLGTHTIKHGETLKLYGIATTQPTNPKAEGKRLAIIYRRKAQPDDYVVDLLEARLPEFGIQVFIDRHLTIGVQWAQAIESEIRTADAVIIILSEKSAASEMVLFELQTAVDQWGKTAKPRILPIRIGSDAPIEGDVGALLNPFQYALWRGPEDDEAMLHQLNESLIGRKSQESDVKLERVGGAMPPGSPFYVIRPTDQEFVNALLDRDSIVLVKGGRQIGKTSLLARSLREAADAGSQVVWTDLQSFGRAQMESDEKLYLAFASEFVSQLDLPGDPFEKWRPMFGANTNFERFLQSAVLENTDKPVIWAIDEVDRLFSVPFSSDFFGMIRSWHNRRAARAEETWNRFTVALAYATEAHLFISDLNQSPFNVGTRLELADFDDAQIRDLNDRYGRPLQNELEIARFRKLVGGQPYLCRRGLDELVRHHTTIDILESQAAHDEGPFGDHLRRLLVALSNDPVLLSEVRKFLETNVLGSEEAFFRLRSGGLVQGSDRSRAVLRCGIYHEYLRRHLLE